MRLCNAFDQTGTAHTIIYSSVPFYILLTHSHMFHSSRVYVDIFHVLPLTAPAFQNSWKTIQSHHSQPTKQLTEISTLIKTVGFKLIQLIQDSGLQVAETLLEGETVSSQVQMVHNTVDCSHSLKMHCIHLLVADLLSSLFFILHIFIPSLLF